MTNVMLHADGLIGAVSALAAGRVSSVELTEACLANAADPSGEGTRVFTRLYDDQSRAAAARSDQRRAAGDRLSPLDGVPVSIKDLFDVAGEVTEAGSKALRKEAVASRDADVVKRLIAAGAVIVGKTVMTEFALSGLGLNPHYGTPLNPWGRETGYIPGGSSSGAAVSVSDHMALGAIGSDTGGSVRVPAAFCGLVGFKPTARRVSLDGVFALSPSLDSVGPIADSVEACAILDAVLSGERRAAGFSGRIRLGLPSHYVLDALEPAVATAFEAAVKRLLQDGVEIVPVNMPMLTEIPQMNAVGGFSAAEGYRAHAELFERVAADCDPWVMERFMAVRAVTRKDYGEALALRKKLIQQANLATVGVAALLMPTTPNLAPTLASMADKAAYMAANLRTIRNAAVANVLDRCAITVPCHQAGAAPVGCTLMGETGADGALLSLAARLERVIVSPT